MKTIKHTRLLAGACVLFCLLAVGCSPVATPSTKSTRSTDQATSAWQDVPKGESRIEPIPIDGFLDRKAEQQARRAEWSPTLSTAECDRMQAALINHHVLASDLMLDVVRELKRCRPDLRDIILLSPDHYLQGGSAILTSKRPYQAHQKTIQIDAVRVDDALSSVINIHQDDEAFIGEHGINAPLAMLSSELPNLRVTPLIVSTSISTDTGKSLANWLKEQMNSGAFVIVSSDGSHYLEDTIAVQKDRETQSALNQHRASFFWTAKDDHACDAKGIWAVMTALPTATWKEIGHGASPEYGGSTLLTTTYVTGVWLKK